MNQLKELDEKWKKNRYFNENYHKVIIPDDPKLLGEFLGAFAVDGCFQHDKKKGHYKINFYLHGVDDLDYFHYLRKLIETEFSKKTFHSGSYQAAHLHHRKTKSSRI